MTVRVSNRALSVGYALLLLACVVSTIGWLAIGAVVAVATYSPGLTAALHASAARGSAWAQGLLAGQPHSEPIGQAVLDYGLSVLNLVLAGFLLRHASRTWVARLLAVAMITSAGAFNLQAHAATAAVLVPTGVNIGGIHEVLLHGVGCATFVVALLLLPTGRWETDQGGVRRLALLSAGVGTLLVVGFGTALLPHTVSCILFFGFAAPLVGLVALPSRTAPESTTEQRSQTRLLFSVLLAAFGTCAVLGVLTLVLWYLGEPGLILVDPTAHSDMTTGQPTALLFWFSRLSAAGTALAVLVAIRPARLWTAERLLSRGLASVMIVVLVGGGYVVTRALVSWLPGADSGSGTIVATALASVLLLPAYQRAERLVDRLLYGQRPTPYSVLAEVAALARTNSTDGPNLAMAAEAIGRGLGARCCRLTVLRPGLRERTYVWSEGSPSDDPSSEGMFALPILKDEERIGSIAVDRGAVAGLHAERRTLLADVAGSLGAILQASRMGIELERQLRAAVAHADDIAASRRLAVSEMDSERRMIERNLHDGAQHHLVTLRLALGLVEHEVASGQPEHARNRLDELAQQLNTIEEVLANTASGVSSIVLSEQGLVAALTSDLSGGEPPIALDFAEGTEQRRLTPAAEAAVYFCCLEAVNNARKHAAGAPITVRLAIVEDELRFSVRDEGPGFDPKTNAGPGRGQRNLAARILAVGGRITVDSTPGGGTTVRGAVPLPVAVEPTVEPLLPPVPPVVPASEPVPSTAAPAQHDGSLLERAEALLAAAKESYPDGPERERLDELAARLTEPLRVVLVGTPGAGTSTLVRALASPQVSSTVTVFDGADGSGIEPDAFVLVLQGPGDDDPSLFGSRPGGFHRGLAPVIGVLARADEFGESAPDALKRATRVAEQYWSEPTIRRQCQGMLVVSALLALAGGTLTEQEYTLLRSLAEHSSSGASEPSEPTSGLLDRFGEFGVRLAIELIRGPSAPDRGRLADELVRHSGLLELRALLCGRFADLAMARRVRSVLTALERLERFSSRTDASAERLRYQLEQFRSGAHELAEIGLADAIRSGRLRLPGAERQLAEQLLGIDGDSSAARLGLAEDAGPEAIRQSAAHQLAHWQRLASHPVTTTAVREAAEFLVKRCELLLAQADN